MLKFDSAPKLSHKPAVQQADLMKYILLAIALTLAVNQAMAHDEANCKNISNLLARLACYDNNHTTVEFSDDQTGIDKTSIPLPKLQPGGTSGLSSDDSSFGKRGDIFGASSDTFLTSSVKDVEESPNRRSRLILLNGQSWELTKARSISASKGDMVEIRRGTVGGYFISVEGGRWFRVKRTE